MVKNLSLFCDIFPFFIVFFPHYSSYQSHGSSTKTQKISSVIVDTSRESHVYITEKASRHFAGRLADQIYKVLLVFLICGDSN